MYYLCSYVFTHGNRGVLYNISPRCAHVRNKESSSHRPVKSSPRPVRCAVRAGIIDPEVGRAAGEVTWPDAWCWRTSAGRGPALK